MFSMYSRTFSNRQDNGIKMVTSVSTGKTFQKALFTTYQFYFEEKDFKE